MSGARAGRLVAGATLLVLVASGCTPPADPPPPSPSSSSVAPTPTENAQEREQRLAYEAAEKSYREFRAEFRRITGSGGASTATKVMRDTAVDPYLSEFVEINRAFKKTNSHTVGKTKIQYVRRGGYSPRSLLLDVCEDETDVRAFNDKGKQIARNGLLKLQLAVIEQGDAWKVKSQVGKKVDQCG